MTKIERALGGRVEGSRIALWGVTFKAGTDDIRESPALDIARRLLGRGATVRAYDPVASTTATDACPGLELATDAYDVCKEVDALAVVTEWDEFRWLNFGRVRDVMARPVIVDARNLLDPTAMRRHGFAYEGVGR